MQIRAVAIQIEIIELTPSELILNFYFNHSNVPKKVKIKAETKTDKAIALFNKMLYWRHTLIKIDELMDNFP